MDILYVIWKICKPHAFNSKMRIIELTLHEVTMWILLNNACKALVYHKCPIY